MQLFVQQLVQANLKENINVYITCPLCEGDFPVKGISSQRVSDAESISMSQIHPVLVCPKKCAQVSGILFLLWWGTG